MTVADWLTSWYFWVLFLTTVGLLIWLYFVERAERKERVCPTCSSPRKRIRYEVRYYLSDYVWHDSPCEDYWHNLKPIRK